MYEDEKIETPRAERPPAGGKVKRLFESPYVVDSPEAPADLSYIGNGRGELIDRTLDEMIDELPEDETMLVEQLELPRDKAS